MTCMAASPTLPPGGVIVIGSNKMGLWHPLNPVFTFVLLLQASPCLLCCATYTAVVPIRGALRGRPCTNCCRGRSPYAPWRATAALSAPSPHLPPLLQWSVPTANQMQNLASMHNNNEQAMGTLIFWQYVAACLALPVWCARPPGGRPTACMSFRNVPAA